MKQNPFKLVPAPTTIGLGMLVILIAVNVVVSEWNIRRLMGNEHRVVHAQRVLTTLEEVLSRVTDAETGERGFLITGEMQYHKAYESAVDAARDSLSRLESLTMENSRQRAQVVALQNRVQTRFDELSRAIEAHRAGGFSAAKQSVLTNQGRRLTAEMRDLVGEMQTQEQRALADRSHESHRSALITTATDLIGAFVGAAMIALAFYLFKRELAHRERADEAVRRLAAIVESSDDSVVSKTLDGIIVSWNAGARRIYGYSPEEAIGRPIAMLCPPERVDEVKQNLERVRSGLHIEHFETTRVRKDGRRIDVSMTISPVKDANDAVIGASVIAHDVTERRILQREVLEIAGREQRRIGQDLHDDTGQELTGLAMMTQRLAAELAAGGLPQAAVASRIVDGLEQALSHVRSLSKGLIPVEVDAEGLMIALTELAARTSELHAVACTFQCDVPVSILDNQTATHLYRLSQEAVTNAVKHGSAGKIKISLAADRDLVTLAICDDGVGFPIDGPESTGTGLRIMRYRADLIGAKLTIDSVSPHGARIACSFVQRHEKVRVRRRTRMDSGQPSPSRSVHQAG